MSFDDTGIAFPIRVLDDNELAAVRAEYQRLVDANGGTLKHFDKAHHKFGWAYDLVLHPRIIDRVSEILGENVLVWGSLILSKPPHDDGFVAWHQDGEYATFLGDAPAVSAWIALSDSTTESGCMRVIPGSHKTKVAHAERGDPKNMLSHGQEIAVTVDESQAVDVILHAGEMSLHHVDIVHGSNPNRASWWRTGFIVRYSTPQMLRAANPVVIARGKRATHLETMERPCIVSSAPK
ncbi:MAG TPA: phytanoyl-CoA dioxygenase family protein [Thermoanaerobaculia bacterium]|nr:phytanoyl-CoA dioxygenase family protein [Thermoanaerobaculia bacterium]